jgi:glucose 1-dehydrogenase
MLLANKVAIVTGGSAGIGRAISLALAQDGAAVTINYHQNEAAAEDTLQQVARASGKAQLVQANVSHVEDIQHLIERTVQSFGRLDVMVNNAGIETRTPLLDTSEQQFEQVINVNLKGAFFGTKYAAKQMIAEAQGWPDH